MSLSRNNPFFNSTKQNSKGMNFDGAWLGDYEDEDEIDSYGASPDYSEEHYEEDNDPALFELSPLKFNHGAQNGRLVKIAAAKSIIVLVTELNHVIRYNYDTLKNISCVIKNEEDIHTLFLDPTANHCIVCYKSTKRSYYINFSRNNKNQPQIMSKMRGKVIESIQWDPDNTNPSSTGDILLGCGNGEIMLTSFSGEGGQKSISTPITLPSADPVCSIQLQLVDSSARTQKYYLVVATPKRFYEFIGPPNFRQLFDDYQNRRIEFRKEVFGQNPSRLFFARPPGYTVAQRLIWETTVGLMDAPLEWNSGERFVNWDDQNDEFLTWSVDDSWVEIPEGQMPIGMEITEFHYLMIYLDRFIAVNRLSQECAQWSKAPENGWVQMCSNGAEQFFIISTKYVYTVDFLGEESRDVWRIYLKQGKYDLAKEYSKNSKQKRKVIESEAEHYFSEHKFDKAAIIYAELMEEKGGSDTMTFEEITLKFVNTGETEALRTFLKARLARLPPSDTTRRTMLCCWLTELLLQKIQDTESVSQNGQTVSDARREFENFLKNHHEDLPFQTTIDLISSHGLMEELMAYSTFKKEFRFVINYYIQTGLFDKALQVLEVNDTGGDVGRKLTDLYYEFAPLLMHEVPAQTVTLLMLKDLDAKELIPKLMAFQHSKQLSSETQEETIRYLEHVVKTSKEKVIHNYLVSLYCQMRKEKALLEYIQETNTAPRYDVKYALRICHIEKMNRACVELYKILGFYEDAVNLALRLDSKCEEAQLVVKEYEKKNKHKRDANPKKLWLMVARYLVEELRAQELALNLISECKYLSIEDILPYLDEFTSLGNFRELIITSLEKYQKGIQELQTKMERLSNTSQIIKNDIDDCKDHNTVVVSSQRCDLTDKPLFGKPFVLFPCSHAFELQALRAKLNEHFKRQNFPKKIIPVDMPETQLVELVGKECPFCGDIMIEEVTTPFLNDEEEITRWRI